MPSTKPRSTRSAQHTNSHSTRSSYSRTHSTTQTSHFSKSTIITGSSKSFSTQAAYRIAHPESSAPPSEIGTSVFGTSVYGSEIQHPSRAPSAAGISRAPSAAVVSRVPTAAAISRAPSAAATSRAPSVAPEYFSRAPSAAGVIRAPSAAGTTRAPSVAGTTRGPPSVAGTTRAPSAAGTTRAPSVAGTTRAPSEAGIIRAPSRSSNVSGIPRAPSAAGIHRSPSATGTHHSAGVPLVHRSPSAAGTTIGRAPSAAGIIRAPSAAGVPLPASVAGSQRIGPSTIGSRNVPPSIAGSAPSVTHSRHTPPPERGFSAAPSDIAPGSESHSGAALRAQARLEGDKMRIAFEASQAAHQAGDGQGAKELADQGRSHQSRMQELHAEAAEQIFREKNDGREPGEIDLHGLFVKEAVSRLSQFIREAPTLGQTHLRVITGKGLHSEGDPQILPAVEESLRKKGLRHHTDETNSGVIIVELGPRSPVSE